MFTAEDILGDYATELKQVYGNYPSRVAFGSCRKRLSEIDRITRKAMTENPSAFHPDAIKDMLAKNTYNFAFFNLGVRNEQRNQ